MVDDVENTVIGVYRRHAAAWAAARGEQLAEGPWLARFAGLIPERGTVLDIGCGPGVPIARELSRRGFTVTGLDAAPEMLALFRSNLPDSHSVLADMRELQIGRRFSGLIAWDSFFHLPPGDQRAMFARFADHAAPGAALLFTSGSAEGVAIGDLEGEALYHASLGSAEYRDLLAASGFDLVDHAIEDPSCGQRTVWLARQRT